MHAPLTAPAAARLEPADTASDGLEPLGPGWITVTVVIGVMAALIALGGMVLSFRAVSQEMIPAFGARWAWLVPIVVDLTVFVFSGVDLVLARLDMSHPLARWTVYAATGGTVWLNYSAGGSAAGRVAHVLMPSIWVVFVELMRHVVRRQTNLATGSHREPIPTARWFLSPWPTLKLWRRMVLWRVNSYPRALEQEKARLSAVATAREVHGRLWRYRISPLTKLQINLGEAGLELLTQPTAVSDGSTAPVSAGSAPSRTEGFSWVGTQPNQDTGPVSDGSADEISAGSTQPNHPAETADPAEIEPSETTIQPVSAVPPLPRRSTRESELLTAAREVERWRGLPSATRISRELGIGMPLATSLANALRDEDEAGGHAVSDGSSSSRTEASSWVRTRPNGAADAFSAGSAGAISAGSTQLKHPAETASSAPRAAQPNRQRVTVTLDDDERPAGRNLRSVEQLVDEALERDPVPTSADRIATELGVGLPKARQVRERLQAHTDQHITGPGEVSR
jgi:hypothetical protein